MSILYFKNDKARVQEQILPSSAQAPAKLGWVALFPANPTTPTPATHPGKFILQPVSILALSQPNPQLSLAQCSSSLSFAEYTELALYSINIASHSHQGKFISQQQLT